MTSASDWRLSFVILRSLVRTWTSVAQDVAQIRRGIAQSNSADSTGYVGEKPGSSPGLPAKFSITHLILN